jgi:hypothetical protein
MFEIVNTFTKIKMKLRNEKCIFVPSNALIRIVLHSLCHYSINEAGHMYPILEFLYQIGLLI